jgi:hypothetical protein
MILRYFSFPMLAIVLLPLELGCGGSARTQLRSFDAATAADKAMEQYDANGDGKSAGDELKNCPALSPSIGRMDKDRDGAISRDELQARFEALDAQSDLVAVSVRVTYRNRPLPDAKVTLTPPPFMGEGLQDYSGTTDSGGQCELAGSVMELPGIPSGFYQARIVHASSNIDTVRGCEIADDASGNRLHLAL